MRLFFAWAIFLFASGGLPVFSIAKGFEELEINGSLKSYNLHAESFPGSDQDGFLSSANLRFDVAGRVVDRYDVEFSLDQQILWISHPGEFLLADTSVNRRFDLERNWRESDRFSGRLQVDRLNLHGESGFLHWTLGRQAIGFGRISLFSPLDVIAPFPPDALDVDVRPGVDAVKATRYYGLAGQIGGVAVFGAEKKYNSYLLTLGENFNQLDLVALTGRLRGRSMFGIGLAGELGKVGVKAELSLYRGSAVQQPRGDLHDDFGMAALEGWYRFDNGLVMLGEYLYNGIGTDDPQDYPLVAVSAPVTEGLSFLLGQHYLLVGPSYQFHPLATVSGLIIYNLGDHSSLIRPQLAISLADNLQLDLFWGVTTGKKTQLEPVSGLPVVHSEFGAVGDSGGLLLRWYF